MKEKAWMTGCIDLDSTREEMKSTLIISGILFFLSCQTELSDTQRGKDSLQNKPATPGTAFREEPNTTDSIHTDDNFPSPDYDTSQWSELIRLDATFLLDLRYATDNNFVHEKMYPCGRCFLRPEVAEAIIKVQKNLRQSGHGLKFFDCYRPRPVQWKLWNKVPDPRYVADPRKGSMHNRGMAVDLTLVDSLGNELNLGTDFDYFGAEAYHGYEKHPPEVIANRNWLLKIMEENGFRSTSTEWWHYSYKPGSFPISDWEWSCE